ncbi:MAG: UvrD-helicase domain-containing protein [Candidatus Dormibacteria bacterium]
MLTQRIAFVLATRDVRPNEICAVTFTNKAAREMKARIATLLGSSAGGIWLGTFHALGVRILRRDGAAIGVGRDFTIYDEADRQTALRRAMAAAGIDEKRYPSARVGHAISAAKNELVDARRYAAEAHGFFDSVVAQAYTAYTAVLADAGALDFDDLLVRCVELLAGVEEVRDSYQTRFRHLFVDEYQDTNKAQYQMVRLLAERHRNLTVVGDDDQSIFGWRGADVQNILSFQRDYPEARRITLEQNYRSTQTILDAAHSVIRHNPERAAKQLWTDQGGGEPVRLLSVYDEQEEALTVAAEIELLMGREGYSLSDCAVLYRTNAQSRAFEDVLLRRGLPYRLVGGQRFYERREVKDVLAYLRLLANPRDPVAFGRIVNVPRRKIGDKTVAELERIARRRGVPPLEAVGQLAGEALGAAAAASLAAFGAMLDELRGLSARLPLPRFVEETLRRTGYEGHLRDGTPEGEERWANVTELVGLAGEYADVPPPEGLAQFLENVALVSDVDTLDDNVQGITLITLHQVKGLEFPVVFIAGMEEGLLPHVRALEEGDSGVAEERRLTYVGITRARRRLYLLHAFRRHLYGQAQLAQASRFLGDLPAELLEVSRRPGAPVTQGVRQPGAVRQAVHEHAARPNPVEHPPQRFARGMRVNHPRHGAGAVLHSTMTRASGEEVLVQFDEGPPRLFAVRDAGLVPLDG